MEILIWPITAKTKQEINNHYRTELALELKEKSPWEIVSRLTFDSAAPNLKQAEVRDLFLWLDKKILAGGLRGVGVELGSGVGFMSSVIASFLAVRKVYAVEVVENIVRQLASRVLASVLGEQSNKVVSCVGEFDHLALVGDSIDFAFDFFPFIIRQVWQKPYRKLLEF